MNNDRFKFRVFIPVENRYMDNEIDNPIIDSSGNLMWCYLDKIGNLKRYEHNLLNRERAVIERCTGLRDRNNKLIYEGDVFEADVLNSFDGDKFIGQKIRGIVAYYPDGACFAFAAYAPMNLGDIEIIGTIHDDQFRDNTKFIEEEE